MCGMCELGLQSISSNFTVFSPTGALHIAPMQITGLGLKANGHTEHELDQLLTLKKKENISVSLFFHNILDLFICLC